MRFAAEHVEAGDCAARHLVAAGGVDRVEGHAGAAPGYGACGGEDAGRVLFWAGLEGGAFSTVD